MARTKIMEKIEHYRKTYTVKEKDDLQVSELLDIAEFCGNDIYSIISNPFTYGYGQGYKAAMAEMKKKAEEAKVI